MSNLKERNVELPLLRRVSKRIIITSGQRRNSGDEKKNANKDVKASWNQYAPGWFMTDVYKPHGGIFKLWKDAGLRKRLRGNKGLADGFIWPPAWPKNTDSDEGGGHSSPGMLLLIARHLVNRAERMLREPINTAEQAVHGAVLATDALELLGGKTPTAAAEALALKHQFAIHAECQFVGVEQRVNLDGRFQDIEDEAENIAQWFRRKDHERASINIRMDVINRMVSVFRQYNQFDEEMVCLARLRRLHHELYMHRSWRVIWWPFLRYAEFLLGSFPKFLLAISLWVLVPVVVIALSSGMDGEHVVEAAINSFFAQNPKSGEGIVTMALTTFVAVAGIAHLGVFISHLYTLVSKR